MLNTPVYNPPFYKGSQWALHNATLVYAGDYKDMPKGWLQELDLTLEM